MRANNSTKRSVRQWLIVSLTLFMSVILSLSCDKKEETEIADPGPADYLAESFETGHKRSSEIRTFIGQDLYELINGGAEVYHLYQFVDVANAYYKAGEVEITADIYRFGNPDMAWGLFSTLRPTQPETASLGVESFKSPVSTNFVKGQFMVRVTGFEPDDATAEATLQLAQLLEKKIKGTTAKPELLGLFPTEGKLPFTEKMIAIDYMGRAGVNEVYTTDFLLDGETVTFFVAEDISGGKYLAWSSQLETEGSLAKADGFSFDADYSFVASTSFYGDIVAGLKNGKLCGMLEYKKSHKEILTAWINSL